MKRILDPTKIELRSFEIIEGMLKGSRLSGPKRDIVIRVIHSTTDPAYAKDLVFHKDAISAGLKAMRSGKDITCDVDMVRVGINSRTLNGFGGRAVCLINDDDVVKEAKRLGVARAIVAMQKAAGSISGSIVAIGNAPTALFELCELVKGGKAKPALIIGTPVGFVGAVEAKKALRSAGIPYITNRSRKGGSSVAAAITNALLKLAKE